MALWNQTSLSDFILLGIFEFSPPTIFLFALVLLAAVTALMGNLLFLLLIQADRCLHTPMYFFLSQLSIMDLTMMVSVVPKMVTNLLSGQRSISWGGCSTQVFLVNIVGGAECFLLAVMAYDRYLAICHPLRYPMLMSWKTCSLLALACWLAGVSDSVIDVSVVFTFPYCASREVDHFFCEIPALLRLSCKDTSLFQDLLYACCVVMLLFPLGIIVASYARVLSAVLGMPSTEGKQKALTTCSSHLTVVGLYYGGAIFSYMQRASARTPVGDRVTSIFYTTLTPMLNPLIYTLRNKEVTRSLRKIMARWGK